MRRIIFAFFFGVVASNSNASVSLIIQGEEAVLVQRVLTEARVPQMVLSSRNLGFKANRLACRVDEEECYGKPCRQFLCEIELSDSARLDFYPTAFDYRKLEAIHSNHDGTLVW